jgi:hypothetical protein
MRTCELHAQHRSCPINRGWDKTDTMRQGGESEMWKQSMRRRKNIRVIVTSPCRQFKTAGAALQCLPQGLEDPTPRLPHVTKEPRPAPAECKCIEGSSGAKKCVVRIEFVVSARKPMTGNGLDWLGPETPAAAPPANRYGLTNPALQGLWCATS